MSEYFGSEILIHAYKEGFFPMAESSEGDIYWHSPDPRAIIPFQTIKTPRSLKQFLKKRNFEYKVNSDFNHVIRACAERDETWINEDIITTYNTLHASGLAHSVETWENGQMVGGLYGVSIGGAFFGESMFNTITNASKAAFYELIRIMDKQDFVLLDSQYINHHTLMLGAVEIPREIYLKILGAALKTQCVFEQ